MLSSLLFSAAQLIRSEVQVIAETHVRSFSTTVRCLRRILFSNGVSFAWNLLFPHQKSGFQVHLLATFWSQLHYASDHFSVTLVRSRVSHLKLCALALYSGTSNHFTRSDSIMTRKSSETGFYGIQQGSLQVHSKVHSSRIKSPPRISNLVM